MEFLQEPNVVAKSKTDEFLALMALLQRVRRSQKFFEVQKVVHTVKN